MKQTQSFILYRNTTQVQVIHVHSLFLKFIQNNRVLNECKWVGPKIGYENIKKWHSD